ncbi:hypothetical protein ACFW04_013608 [Cataglyphis niger]
MYDENEFIARYRLCKERVLRIVDLIHDKIKTKIMSMQNYTKVTIALASECHRYIRFPENISRVLQYCKIFTCYWCNRLYACGEVAKVFQNKKGFFSINVQAVCNNKLQFQIVVTVGFLRALSADSSVGIRARGIARWPGSTHDATIFVASYLHARFVYGKMQDGILLRDNGYPYTKLLMTPLLQTHNRAEELYNESQVQQLIEEVENEIVTINNVQTDIARNVLYINTYFRRLQS